MIAQITLDSGGHEIANRSALGGCLLDGRSRNVECRRPKMTRFPERCSTVYDPEVAEGSASDNRQQRAEVRRTVRRTRAHRNVGERDQRLVPSRCRSRESAGRRA
jgi:hypothetical protein